MLKGSDVLQHLSRETDGHSLDTETTHNLILLNQFLHNVECVSTDAGVLLSEGIMLIVHGHTRIHTRGS